MGKPDAGLSGSRSERGCVHVPGLAIRYADPHLSLSQSATQNAQFVTLVVKAVDGYLLTAILLIFGWACTRCSSAR